MLLITYPRMINASMPKYVFTKPHHNRTVCRDQGHTFRRPLFSLLLIYLLCSYKLQAIKALQDKLAEIKDSVAPRPKFSFKTARKNPSAVSLSEAAEIARERRRDLPGYKSGNDSSAEPSTSGTPAETDRLKEDAGNANGTGQQAGVSPLSISGQKGQHVVLPMTASHVTVPASVTSIERCAIDMSVPTTKAQPFATLTLKGVSSSLLACGQVNGAAHITKVENSVIVVSCHQFRMHDCKNVDIYLSCSSKPIIEDCSNVRFYKIPKAYVRTSPLPPFLGVTNTNASYYPGD